MKLSFLLIAGLIVSGLAFTSMTSSPVIDEVEVTDPSIPSTTTYYVEHGGATPGTVVIDGTQTQPPVDNSTGGKNYKCVVSEEVCYTCDNCQIKEIN